MRIHTYREREREREREEINIDMLFVLRITGQKYTSPDCTHYNAHPHNMIEVHVIFIRGVITLFYTYLATVYKPMHSSNGRGNVILAHLASI